MGLGSPMGLVSLWIWGLLMGLGSPQAGVAPLLWVLPRVAVPRSHPFSPTPQSQGALAGRLRSFSMQDLRSLPDEAPVHYRDPLYLEEQESRRQPPGEPGAAWPRGPGGCARAIGWPLAPACGAAPRRESETDEEEECWSDSQVSPKPTPHPRDPRPLSRSQSLRTVKKKPQGKEGSSRLVRGRARKKPAPTGQDS
ncbi:receptor expression-enhancing protein 4-like [Oxyura jamaicensis]|uniref:receptor expression-enhancing protein 4-like n=1 Tax=Oxyura jamaicensis TaxID=8884 RepID=UPI0015A6E720|nr:receptor expression-enhancing protein 4-like [Oxyura jamaicensis]